MQALYAGVAELADAQDLKSCGTYTPIRVRFPLPAYSPGGILNAFAWPLTVYRKQRVFIVYCVDYQGI